MSIMPKISWVVSLLLSLLLTVIMAVLMLYIYLTLQLPDVSALKDLQLQVPLQVYTADKKLMGDFGPTRRASVTYEQIPPLFIKALLATEDQRFFEHNGVDIYGLMRAIVNLAHTGSKSQGGSTITMQVARNFYLTRQKTYTRKLEEILLALKIDRELGKEKILELYLNKIYFGQQAYGISAAAQAYYGKSLDQLTLPEMAVLAGLPKAPSLINPINNPIAAKDRRDHVLSRMLAMKDISQAEYQQAVNTPIHAAYHGRWVEVWSPYAGEMVRTMMANIFGDVAFTHSYKVYTTIDSRLQLYANQAIRDGLLAYDQRHGYRGPMTHLSAIDSLSRAQQEKYLTLIPYANGLQPALVLSIDHQKNNIHVLVKNKPEAVIPAIGFSWTRVKLAENLLKRGDVIWVNQNKDNSWQLAQIPMAQAALVSLDPNTGAILAAVGGFDFRLSNFNRVQANRQPGSGFKPFIYAGALDKGYTLASLFNDAPLVFANAGSPEGEWRPQNDEKDFSGPTRLRVALARSLNLVSIRILQAIGLDYAINYLTRFGFDPAQLPRNLTLALGTAGVTPLQMANGYAVFANGGYRVNPYLIDKVVDSSGNIIFQYQAKPLQRVLSPETDFLMVDALKTVIDEGTGSKALALNRTDLAGKTGTTNDKMDAWFNGFNSDIDTTVWVGFDKPRPLKEYARQFALPIWIDFMGQALKGKPMHSVPQPSNVIAVKIDPITGLLARQDKEGIFEYFMQNNVPQQTAPDSSIPSTAGDTASNEAGEPIF